MIICRHRVQSGVGSISQPCNLDCAQTRRLSNTQGSLTFFLMVRASFLDRHKMIAQTPEPERTNAAVHYHVLPTASSPLTPPSHSSCESLNTSRTDFVITILHCTLSQYNLAESSHQSKSTSLQLSTIGPSHNNEQHRNQVRRRQTQAGKRRCTPEPPDPSLPLAVLYSQLSVSAQSYRTSVAVFEPNPTPNAETNAIAAAAAVSGASASKIRTSCGLPDSGREILYVLLRIKGRACHCQ